MGREISKAININLTSDIPGTIDTPSRITTRKPQIKIAGTISNPTGYTIRINGNAIPITPEGRFETTLNLQWGENNIPIEVTNPIGQRLTTWIIAT